MPDKAAPIDSASEEEYSASLGCMAGRPELSWARQEKRIRHGVGDLCSDENDATCRFRASCMDAGECRKTDPDSKQRFPDATQYQQELATY